MARPPVIRDEDILEAARAVLLERGLSSTTADVAARAGVSEGTVFHRFKTKERLFRACMELDAPDWLRGLPARIGKGDIRDQLAEVCHEGMTFFRLLVPMVMLEWSKEPAHGQRFGEGDPPPIRGMKTLAAYFEAEMALGRLAKHDPEVVARVLSGALWNFVSMELMFGSAQRLPLAESTFVRSLVRLLFEGLATEPPRAAPPSGPSLTGTKQTKKR